MLYFIALLLVETLGISMAIIFSFPLFDFFPRTVEKTVVLIYWRIFTQIVAVVLFPIQSYADENIKQEFVG